MMETKLSTPDPQRLKEFAENCLRFFYEGDTGIMLSPSRAERYSHLHQELFYLVRDRVIDNVVAEAG